MTTAAPDSPGPAPRQQDAAPDPLRVAGRLALLDGEQFAGSGRVSAGDGALLLAAAVDTPTGRQVHLGVVCDEDRKNWRGAHAPAKETVADDEDGEEYGADTTVVLDATDAARLGEIADDVIARATAADREFRQLTKDFDRLYDRLLDLETQRFGDRAQAEKKVQLDWREQQEMRTQRSRRATLDACAARLSPADRTVYDALQEQLDAPGRDAWDPDRIGEAAAICGLTPTSSARCRTSRRCPT